MQEMMQDSNVPEYHDAFKTLRGVRCLFATLSLLSILVFLAAFVIIEFTSLMEAQVSPASTAKEAPQAAEGKQPPPATASAQPDSTGKMIEVMMADVLPAARFVAVVSAMLLAVAFMQAYWAALVGRLGGVSSFLSAFWWSVILLALLVPWDQVFPSAWAVPALFGLDFHRIPELKQEWIAQRGQMPGLILYYARFIGYPVIAVLFWLVAMVKFGRGYGRMNLPTAVSIEQGGGYERPERPGAQ